METVESGRDPLSELPFARAISREVVAGSHKENVLKRRYRPGSSSIGMGEVLEPKRRGAQFKQDGGRLVYHQLAETGPTQASLL